MKLGGFHLSPRTFDSSKLVNDDCNRLLGMACMKVCVREYHRFRYLQKSPNWASYGFQVGDSLVSSPKLAHRPCPERPTPYQEFAKAIFFGKRYHRLCQVARRLGLTSVVMQKGGGVQSRDDRQGMLDFACAAQRLLRELECLIRSAESLRNRCEGYGGHRPQVDRDTTSRPLPHRPQPPPASSATRTH